MSTTEPASAGAETAGQNARVDDLTEEEFLAVVTPLPPRGPQTSVGAGGDCAVLSFPGSWTTVSTDVLVEGRHLYTQWSTGRGVGTRAAAQNSADATATGVEPVTLVVGLVMPASAPVGWVRDLVRGLAQDCEPCGTGVVGDNLSGGDPLIVPIMILGDFECGAPVLRNGVQPSDAMMYVGALGHGAVGLALLSVGSNCALSSRAVVPSSQEHPQAWACIEAFHAPAPPLAAGRDLTLAGTTSILDVSDGLLRDAGRIAHASDVVTGFGDPGDLPDASSLEPMVAFVNGRDGSAAHALAHSRLLIRGEDHELPATVLVHALDRPPAGARAIGRVLSPQSLPAQVLGHRLSALLAREPAQERIGWDHFSRA